MPERASSSSAWATSAARRPPRASCATCSRERGLDGEIELDSAGTGGWHVGSPPDARATERRARARDHAGGRGAAGHARGLRGLRPARRDGPRQPARPAGDGAAPGAEHKVRLREFDPAVDGRPRRARPLLRRRARLRGRPRPRRGRLRAACSTICGRPAERRVAAPVASVAIASRGGDINDAWAVELDDGRRGCSSRRARARRPASTPPRPPGCAGSARRRTVPEVVGGRRRLPRAARGSTSGSRSTTRRSAAASPRCTRAGAAAFGGDRRTAARCASAPLELPSAATARTGRRSTRAGGSRRCADQALERGALSREGRAAIERVCERMADLAGPPEPTRRACTATCGRAT